MNLLGIISVSYDVTDHLLIKSFVFVRYWRKKLKYSETIHELFVDFKKAVGTSHIPSRTLSNHFLVLISTALNNQSDSAPLC
jgi:hypothetical protein